METVTEAQQGVQLFTPSDYKEGLPCNNKNVMDYVASSGILIVASLVVTALGAGAQSLAHENAGVAPLLFMFGVIFFAGAVVFIWYAIRDRRQYRSLEGSKRDGNWLLDDISLIERSYGINDIRDESGRSLREYAQTHKTVDDRKLVGRFPVTALADDGSLHHLTMQVEKGGLLRIYEGDGSVQHLLIPGKRAGSGMA